MTTITRYYVSVNGIKRDSQGYENYRDCEDKAFAYSGMDVLNVYGVLKETVTIETVKSFPPDSSND